MTSSCFCFPYQPWRQRREGATWLLLSKTLPCMSETTKFTTKDLATVWTYSHILEIKSLIAEEKRILLQAFLCLPLLLFLLWLSRSIHPSIYLSLLRKLLTFSFFLNKCSNKWHHSWCHTEDLLVGNVHQRDEKQQFHCLKCNIVYPIDCTDV